MVAANFFGDFEFYRARGHIGPVIHIKVLTPNPSLGGICQIQFNTDGEVVFARVPDRPYFQVYDRSVIQIPILQDESFHISLVNRYGIEMAVETITPFVAVPRILQLDLPAQVSYAEGGLSVLMLTHNTREAVAHYRKAGSEPWEQTQENQNGFFIPLIEETCQLEIRIQLRSIHADLTERGRLTIFRTVVIVHPVPSVSFTQSEQIITRFSEVVCKIHVEWASQLKVEYANENLAWESAFGQMVIDIDLPIHTQELGRQEVQIQAVGRDGIIHRFVQQLEIAPRTVTLLTSQNSDGSVSFEFSGGTDLMLYIDSRAVEMSIDFDAGELIHAFHWPTSAQLVCRDDRDLIRSIDLVLGPPEQPWIDLPTFSEMPGWRIK